MYERAGAAHHEPDGCQSGSINGASTRWADVILLDLASGSDPSDAVAIGPPVVAYGPHVDVDALDAALAGSMGATDSTAVVVTGDIGSMPPVESEESEDSAALQAATEATTVTETASNRTGFMML